MKTNKQLNTLLVITALTFSLWPRTALGGA